MNNAPARRLPAPAQGTRAERTRHLIITPRLARRPARAPAGSSFASIEGELPSPHKAAARQATKPKGQRPAPTAPGRQAARRPPSLSSRRRYAVQGDLRCLAVLTARSVITTVDMGNSRLPGNLTGNLTGNSAPAGQPAGLSIVRDDDATASCPLRRWSAETAVAALQRRRYEMDSCTPPGRQIGSECLIMPNTCPGRPPAGVLPAQGSVALFPEKRMIGHRSAGLGGAPPNW
jgi:hypothetical protein